MLPKASKALTLLTLTAAPLFTAAYESNGRPYPPPSRTPPSTPVTPSGTCTYGGLTCKQIGGYEKSGNYITSLASVTVCVLKTPLLDSRCQEGKVPKGKMCRTRHGCIFIEDNKGPNYDSYKDMCPDPDFDNDNHEHDYDHGMPPPPPPTPYSPSSAPMKYGHDTGSFYNDDRTVIPILPPRGSQYYNGDKQGGGDGHSDRSNSWYNNNNDDDEHGGGNGRGDRSNSWYTKSNDDNNDNGDDNNDDNNDNNDHSSDDNNDNNDHSSDDNNNGNYWDNHRDHGHN